MGRLRNWQDDVNDFHVALGIPTAIGDGQDIEFRRIKLRAELLSEEVRECLEAMTGQQWEIRPTQMAATQDLTEAVDGLVDTIVVACGAACEWGVDLQPIWEEIHRTNMAKKDGPEREDGKRLKPEGWEPPDVESIIAGQQEGKVDLREWAAARRARES